MKKGVSVIETKEELRQIKEGVIVIRSHGVAKEIYDQIEQQGLECVDATCPFVKRIHNIVEKESANGKQILIIGNAGHPEVEGLWGGQVPLRWWRSAPKKSNRSNVIPISRFVLCRRRRLTTINFKNLLKFSKKGYDISVVNTICNATEERQTEAKEIAAKVDAMIIIGGRHSSNTRKLYEICSRECADTYFIQTLDDLHLDLPKSVRLVGITAGASTPNKIIEEVQNYVRINF